MNGAIILYLFTTYGVFVWDTFPTYQSCWDIKIGLDERFKGGEAGKVYTECIELGVIIR
jgi:hypothetical protein